MIKVAKFGGSSVSSAEQFRKVKSIILSDPARKFVVVSAAGKKNSSDHKMTDLLYLCHAHLSYGVDCDNLFGKVRERLVEIRDELGLRFDIESALDDCSSKFSKDTDVDELVSRGEYFTAQLMAEYLGYHFVDAADCVYFGFDGRLDFEKTYAAIKKYADRYEKIVVPGFYGVLPNNRIKLMSRGGGDITGAIVARAVNADIYENWTDVSGIQMADPRVVENPKAIAEMTYSELHELALMGASVLHDDSILPVKEAGIPLNIRNTNKPEDKGTMIRATLPEGPVDGTFLTGIAGRKNFDLLTFRKHGMSGSGELRKALEIIDRFHISVEHINLGIDSFNLVISASALGSNLYDILEDIQKECKPDELKLQDKIALVASIDRNMMLRSGISDRQFRALGDAGINIRVIAQGADGLSLIIGVDNEQYNDTIRILYDAFMA